MAEKKSLTVLLAVDGSPHSEAAVTLAGAIGWPAGTWVQVLAIAREQWSLLGLGPQAQEVVGETLANVRQSERAAAEGIAAEAAERLRRRGLPAEAVVDEGRPSEMILQRAADLPANVIVIGARGLTAPGEFQLGSTAHKLAHYAQCSVLVARPPERQQPLTLLVGADGSPEARRAAEFLCELSLPGWAEVTVVSVAEAEVGTVPGERRPVADVPEVVRQALIQAAEGRAAEAAEHLGSCGAQVHSAIRLGHGAGEILAVAQEQDADLIVIGARGWTRAEPFLLGGVAQKIVKYATCSVLVVR